MIALFRLVYPFVVIVLAWLALLARSSASKNAAPQPADPLGRAAADQWFRLLGITPRIAAEADGHEALLTLVALGYGTGIIPRLVLQHSGVRPRLHEVPTPSGPGELVIGVCVRRTDLHRPPGRRSLGCDEHRAGAARRGAVSRWRTVAVTHTATVTTTSVARAAGSPLTNATKTAMRARAPSKEPQVAWTAVPRVRAGAYNPLRMALRRSSGPRS